MRFQVRQKIFSFGDSFTIKDESDIDYYQVQGKVFSLGDKLSFQDMQGNELYYIEQQLMRMLAEYKLYSNGQVVARCQKRFSLFGSKFDIVNTTDNYTIDGKPLNYNYSIMKNGQLVATVDKQFFSLSDTYGVDIKDGEDYAFILSLVIIIDQVVHDNEGQRH